MFICVRSNGVSSRKTSKREDPVPMYIKVVKRLIDIILTGLAMILLSWLFVIIIIAIFIDDPGPVIFTQKRVGRNKTYFNLHKFRSMKMSTPHDIPTHLLDRPDQYITRVGRILRKTSLDELPQLYDIDRKSVV